MRYLIVVFFYLSIGGLSGCSVFNDGVSTSRLIIKAGERINPDVNGRPSPVEIILYQLNGKVAFDKVIFTNIYSDPDKYLSDELVSIHRLGSVSPLETKEFDIVIDDKTQYIGIVSGFSNYRNADTKSLIEKPDEEDFTINLDIVHTEITANKG